MPGTRFGTFDDLLQLTGEPLRPVVERLRAIVLEVDPKACEVVRLGDRAATYGVGPRKMIEGYAYLMPHRAWVNLGFFQGASLDDPRKQLEGTGVRMRHLKVRSVADAERDGIRELLAAALAERRSALNL